MTGTLHGIGVGPGDPELMTVKAWRILSTARIVFYLSANGGESLARTIAAPFMPDDAEEFAIDMPMRPDPESAANIYNACAEQISTLLQAGRDVVMLCEGDPLFYGSFAYILERLKPSHNIEVVPGITSVSATATALGSALTHRNDVLKILPATLPNTRLENELEDFDTVIIMKVGRHFERIRALLSSLNLLSSAHAVERASQSNQRILTLSDQDIGDVSYFTTIVIKRKDVA